MPRPRSRPRPPRAAAALLLLLAGVAACAAPQGPPHPDDLVKAAQLRLTDACLTRQGLTPPRPGPTPPSEREALRVSDALFGTGRAELSLTLATGHEIRAHTDGCLAAAHRRLYGDERAWFRASAVVNNLRPEAAHRGTDLASVRRTHGAEIADWERMRAHALRQAEALLDRPPGR
ncbi:hypothetical protein [Streptomyces sp. t39]|uniref:hypothetical protein n=1 Tax=Streptomyces sp. t39 TaxID=1828156 RepID=UPI0011CE6744|nr:hypothetical protein [Streptomyces sp. t39]TXS52905.1 hypothetical protein EAO77_18955 [Streptomyces sp. t39]